MPSAFDKTAAPDEAQRDFEAFCQSYRRQFGKDWPKTAQSHALELIFGNSRFLSAFLIRSPEMAESFLSLCKWDCEKSLEDFKREIDATTRSVNDKNALIKRLKHFKYAEYLRLTLKELHLKDQSGTYREFSRLCFSITEVLADSLWLELVEKHHLKYDAPGDVALIAMGKLGGEELNYSSDIDIIGLYESESEIGETTRHEFYTKFFTEIGKGLEHYDENGFLYRVDWDLRPEGKTGTLANSLAAMETYYEAFGEDWERQAFIKADVLYQRSTLGKRFLAMMTPFAYRKYIDVKTFERLRDMKSRIIVELGKKKLDGINIKIGHGGIRDVEFIVQGLQLLNGGKIPVLRARGTLNALELLKTHDLIAEKTAELLKRGYLFLRRIESALQMEDERQTHLLKNSPMERLKVARRLGYAGTADQALNAFSEELQKTSDFIHKTFRSFYE